MLQEADVPECMPHPAACARLLQASPQVHVAFIDHRHTILFNRQLASGCTEQAGR
jgi:hypothetical protein